MSIGHKVRVALRQSLSVASSLTMPRDKSLQLERHMRGKEEARLLRDSQFAVISFGKSGRTWLCVLLSRYYQLRYGLPANLLLQNDSMRALNRAIPQVLFTHDNYLRSYAAGLGAETPYAGSNVVLLARHPADTAVSQFFQWKFRMKDRKRLINAYPTIKDDLPLIDFVLGEEAGIPKIVRFMNQWASEFDKVKSIHIVRYETLRRETARTLGGVLEFMHETPTAQDLDQCVEFASVENMRKMEQDTFFRGVGDRMTPGDADNPDSFKVRRAKVGGYRDYFTAEEAARIDELVARILSPAYGYSEAPPDPRVV
jgi:hypothetical protein